MYKVYVAGPYTLYKLPKLHKAIISNLEVLGFDVYDSHRVMTLDKEKLILEQHHAIRESDFVVAEVTKPSHGVGMEIALARVLGKPVICFKKRGAHISNTIYSIANLVIEYKNVKDFIEKIKDLNFHDLEKTSMCPLICPLAGKHHVGMKSHKSLWKGSTEYK